MSEKVTRADWPNGPWDDEPDRDEWIHAELFCLIKRHPKFGHWCGYVGITKEHPWFGKHYNDCILPGASAQGPKPWMDEPGGTFGALPPLPEIIRQRTEAQLVCNDDEGYCEHQPQVVIQVHGGLTFSEPWDDTSDKIWWFGLDCNHAGDFAPGMYAIEQAARIALASPWQAEAARMGSEYRSYNYVKEETNKLAEQLASVVSMLPRRSENDTSNTQDVTLET